MHCEIKTEMKNKEKKKSLALIVKFIIIMLATENWKEILSSQWVDYLLKIIDLSSLK